MKGLEQHSSPAQSREQPSETEASAQLLESTTALTPDAPRTETHSLEGPGLVSGHSSPWDYLVTFLSPTHRTGYNFLKAEKILPKKINTAKQLSPSVTYLDYIITAKSSLSQ